MGDSKLKQIAGQHYETFEAYFLSMDNDRTGIIKAMDAAKFLKKSGLSDVVLSRVWDLSDPQGNGYLDKAGFYTALKLVSLAQVGEEINLRNILNAVPHPPKCGEIPKKFIQAVNQIRCIPVGNVDWSIQPQDHKKYEDLFYSMQPENGLIGGNKVRGKLMESKLPIETLGRIWDLADQDKDGSLDKHEFIVAWHLVCLALGRRIVPETLPPILQRAKAPEEFVAVFPDRISPPPAVPPLPAVIQKQPVPARPPPMPSAASLIDIGGPPMVTSIPASNEWVVTTMQKLRFDEWFEKADLDHDGLVTGPEIKDLFLKSGLPQKTLADIWGVCDTNSCGKLTREQFALAMWMVERKQRENIDPPKELEPNMIPPSMRAKIAPPPVAASALSITAAMPLIPDDPPQPSYSNPELQMVSEDIQKLAKERRQLELEVAQKEADIKIKNGEVRSLESELTTLAATLKQLEYQKGEAQKRLDDLKAQVDKIRDQCQKQEQVLKETEGEVDTKRAELTKLKEEEQALQKEFNDNQQKLELLSKILQDTQLQISQVKAMLTQLEETKRQMSDSLTLCKAAIEQNDPNSVPDYSLNLEPELHQAKLLLEDRPEPTLETKPAEKSNGFKETFTTDESWDDPFGANAAASQRSHGFDDSFSTAFDSKPDPFAPAAGAAVDPFAPKAGSAQDSHSDAFGSDPFAMLHAPRSQAEAAALAPSPSRPGPPARPESPSPALPPKKAKQPPQRPPPPRPTQGPNFTKSPATDAFGDSGFGGSSSGFANFADFDNKNVQVQPPPSQASQILTTVVASDFSDDPFKNYRYEDVFNIEDPFDENKSTIKETFSDIEPSSPAKKSGNDDDHRSKSVNETSQHNFESPFKSDNNNFFTLKPSSKTKADDFFDAFNDNFSTKKSSTLNLNAYKSYKTAQSDSNGNAFTSDPFGDSKNSTSNTSSVSNKDAMGFASFDEFGDNFGEIKINDNNFNSTANVLSKDKKDNFASFDAFNSSSNNNNNFKVNNNKGLGSGYAKPMIRTPHRTTERPHNISKKDFSQDDTFSDDLAAVLERSKLEK